MCVKSREFICKIRELTLVLKYYITNDFFLLILNLLSFSKSNLLLP
jgi:hypothetical protein